MVELHQVLSTGPVGERAFSFLLLAMHGRQYRGHGWLCLGRMKDGYEQPPTTAILLPPFVTFTRLMLSFYKYLACHRNEGLKATGNFYPRLPSTSLSIPSALLKIIPSEQLLRVQVPNCRLIL